MKTDVTLFEIFNELGLLEIMQSPSAQEFIKDECNNVYAMPDVIAA